MYLRALELLKKMILFSYSREVTIIKVLTRIQVILHLSLFMISGIAQGTVFINEVFINPPGPGGNPGEGDGLYEYIELFGVPNRRLDGYAIAVLNGTKMSRQYPLGSIPPVPDPGPEIDEFFSLDGLTLGDNGLLVLGIGTPDPEWVYSALLSDSNFQKRDTIWNGNLDSPGEIFNNGSLTIMLIRNRPGITEANPTDPNGLLWGKEIQHDHQLITPVNGYDQFGNGNIDRGEPNGMGGYTHDLTGLWNSDLSDDLEIVDEVSYEDSSGWEYDTDGRHVDEFSSDCSLPHRHVHALDDPDGFSPDAISRVDYRTKGEGWAPSGGGIGEMNGGRNWQDTATEQWIRGQSLTDMVIPESRWVAHFYDITGEAKPCSVQPYETHVPLWLDDGIGTDFDFLTAKSYEIAAGRINKLAIPFIPGDTDRDGDCDNDDIIKIAAVFGDDDWIFSNSFWDAPEGDEVDPNTQTKPWDVNLTGDNGIEPSDLQWVLNFQGDTTGQIVGIQYDSTTPASSGVVLNSNAGVDYTVSTSINIPSGRTLSTLFVGDIVEITVNGQVAAGANTTGGEKNGIMQYVHDVLISSGGIIKVKSVEALGSFSKTRASLEALQGTDGDLGIEMVNGYTTSFTEGLSGPTGLYRITLQAISAGSTDIDILPAAVMPPSLEAFWRMDDNEPNYPTVVDNTGNHDGIAQQYTGDLHIEGKINGALTFNGTSDYIDVGEVIGTGAYTKLAWVKRANGVNLYNNMISSDVSSHLFWAPYHQEFKLTAGHNTTWYIVQDSVPLDVDVWYHVAVTFDPAVDSGTMVLYKNGVEVDRATDVPTQNPSNATYIGRYLTGYYFKGSIDEVMVFSRALTEEEFGTLYENMIVGTFKFTESTPEGLKIGHTDNNGDPASSVYPGTLSVTTSAPPADFDGDEDVSLADFAIFVLAWQSDDTPTPNWNPDCDISNPTGVINIDDLITFTEFWLVGTDL